MSTTPKTATLRENLVANLRVAEMAEQLPYAVFPMCVKVKADRTSVDDNWLNVTVNGRSVPASREENVFPLDIRVTEARPEIPEQRVWFDNPAEFPEAGTRPWPFDRFVECFQIGVNEAMRKDPTFADRIYLSDLRLVEITPERGDAADYINDPTPTEPKTQHSDAFEENIAARIATFNRRPKVNDESVREALGAASPGRVIKPLKLQSITAVRFKQHRGSSMTTGRSTRTRYFSAGQAQKPGRTRGYVQNGGDEPFTWDDPDWTVVAEQMPALAASDYVAEVEFDGVYRTDDTFVEENVRFIDHSPE